MIKDKALFWKDLSGAAAVAILVIAMLHLPLFA